MRVVGVDVGIRHLALAEVAQRWVGRQVVTSILGFHLSDITQYTHERVPEKECTLHHTNELGDRLVHWRQEHGHILDRATVVAIERQPPTGLQCVQSFLFSTYRETVCMIHPRTLHKHHGIGILDYEQRKRYMEEHARRQCAALGVDWDKSTARFSRRHDVADALAIAMYAISPGGHGLKQNPSYEGKAPRSRIDQPIVVSKYFRASSRY